MLFGKIAPNGKISGSFDLVGVLFDDFSMKSVRAKLAGDRRPAKDRLPRQPYAAWSARVDWRDEPGCVRAELRRNIDYNDLQRDSSCVRVKDSNHGPASFRADSR